MRGLFARHLGVLMLGTLAGQLVYFAATPVLTRLYDPAAFALFALFMALVSAVAPAVAGRYELALLVVGDATERRRLLEVALLLAAGLSALTAIALIVLRKVGLLEAFDSLGWALHLAPAAIFLSAAVSALRCHALAMHEHRRVAMFSAGQPVIAAGVGLALGALGFVPWGLLAAACLGLVLTACWMAAIYHRELAGRDLGARRDRLELAMRLKDYPLFSAPAVLLDGLALALPVIFLTRYQSAEAVGYYALINRVAMAPLNFVAQSLGPLNTRHVATLLREGRDALAYLGKLLAMLAAVAAVPMAILVVWGRPLFSVVFGPQWEPAGDVIAILLPGIAVRFIASTLSGAMISSGHLRLVAAWQVLNIAATSAMFLTVGQGATTREIFFYIVVTDLALYGLYLGLIVHAVRHPKATHREATN